MGTTIIDLILDEGNTRTKMALFSNGSFVQNAVMVNGDRVALRTFLGQQKVAAIVLGSVALVDHTYVDHLRSIAPLLLVQGDTPVPFGNNYGSRATLGADRLANVAGAWCRSPGRAILVIDPGTCITYDVLEADGTYVGGAITPGVHMRALAMSEHSARLPLVALADNPPMLGDSTEASLRSGIYHGIVGEMRHFISCLGQERPGMAVVLTGGDAMRFARALKSGIFAHPLLTLEGLHAILLHHRTHLGFPAGDPPLGGGRTRSAG